MARSLAEAVFWDTAAYLALGNLRDRLHKSAVGVSRRLEGERAQVVTTDAVLIEVANAFREPQFRPTAQSIIDAMLRSAETGGAEIVHVDKALWQAGYTLFTERLDKSWSLTDCISFVVMEQRGITRVFTSDQHFAQAGHVPLLQP